MKTNFICICIQAIIGNIIMEDIWSLWLHLWSIRKQYLDLILLFCYRIYGFNILCHFSCRIIKDTILIKLLWVVTREYELILFFFSRYLLATCWWFSQDDFLKVLIGAQSLLGNYLVKLEKVTYKREHNLGESFDNSKSKIFGGF